MPSETTEAVADADLAVLRFSDGIPGFPGATHFALSDLTVEGTFQLLTCLDDPELTIVVASPWLFFPDYAPDVPTADVNSLGLDDPDEVALFCTVIADDDEDRIALNLRAPFVANTRTLAARQVVLEEDLPLRAYVPAGD
ncbi:MAG: flagellar assembly protein FliW [Nitriliruptoraceae bacterium]